MDFSDLIASWQNYLLTVSNWEALITGIEPKQTGCGKVYELTNPIDRPNESFAIADMREIPFGEPHYHTNGESEIYFVLQGSGLVVVGGKEQPITKDSVVVTPPDTAHFILPHENLVIAVVNTPPFQAENYIPLTESNEQVQFDLKQFETITQKQ